ncbi:Conserved_hypothetical protein [Hexamita inflata]|uniref:Uncharacterized protein n=1 Tax=Hexamita inflata TaxID=28002 RepID=A0AA86TZP2_9EUKA|nr:Conserved hypothetical protein [Hexamita inflata]
MQETSQEPKHSTSENLKQSEDLLYDDQFDEHMKQQLEEMEMLQSNMQEQREQFNQIQQEIAKQAESATNESLNFEDLQEQKTQMESVRNAEKIDESAEIPSIIKEEKPTKEELALAFNMFKGDTKQSPVFKPTEEVKVSPKPIVKTQQINLTDEALSMPKPTQFHMPRAPDANPKQFIDEMVKLFCSFEPHGSISDAIVSRFKQNTEQIIQPPTICDIIADISENKSYREEKIRFMRSRKSVSHFSLNLSQTFSSAMNAKMKDFNLMNDIGDIMLQYGKQTGFKLIIPQECVKGSYSELKILFEQQLPRCCFGITMNMVGVLSFCKEIYLDRIYSQNELQTLFYRAVFCQNKYIVDYVELNPIRRPSETKKVQIFNFDFLQYSNNISAAKKPDYQILSGGTVKNLCYIGFLQFLYIIAADILHKYNQEYLFGVSTYNEQSRQAEEEEEESEQDNQQKNYSLSVKNASDKRMIQTIRDPFASVSQLQKVDDRLKSVDNTSYQSAWKTAYAFGCFMDCYVLRFAKRYGINVRNEFMEKNVFDSKENMRTIAKYKNQLTSIYQKCCLEKEFITGDGIYKVLQKTGCLDKISKNFIFEYITRNYIQYDNSFVPVLCFEEFLNCLFVAANCAFCVHPFIQFLKTSSDRFEYCVEKAVGVK